MSHHKAKAEAYLRRAGYDTGGDVQDTGQNMADLQARAKSGDNFAADALDDISTSRSTKDFAATNHIDPVSEQRGEQSAQDFIDATRDKYGRNSGKTTIGRHRGGRAGR